MTNYTNFSLKVRISTIVSNMTSQTPSDMILMKPKGILAQRFLNLEKAELLHNPDHMKPDHMNLS